MWRRANPKTIRVPTANGQSGSTRLYFHFDSFRFNSLFLGVDSVCRSVLASVNIGSARPLLSGGYLFYLILFYSIFFVAIILAVFVGKNRKIIRSRPQKRKQQQKVADKKNQSRSRNGKSTKEAVILKNPYESSASLGFFQVLRQSRRTSSTCVVEIGNF